jgi:hypothetical protein
VTEVLEEIQTELVMDGVKIKDEEDEGVVDGVGDGVEFIVTVIDCVIVSEVVGEVLGLLLRVDMKEFEQLIISEVEPLKEQADGQLQGMQDEEPEDE